METQTLKQVITGLKDTISFLKIIPAGNIQSLKEEYLIQALQTAISYLETLQKVQEAGGAKRKYPLREDFCCLSCGDSIDIALGNAIFNQALDLKDAELAGKLEGLKKMIEEYATFSDVYNKNGKKISTIKLISNFPGLADTIQELILGKKEE